MQWVNNPKWPNTSRDPLYAICFVLTYGAYHKPKLGVETIEEATRKYIQKHFGMNINENFFD